MQSPELILVLLSLAITLSHWLVGASNDASEELITEL